jgi:hypothetical protein
MREFPIVQQATVLVAKNFNNYLAEKSLLDEINDAFGLHVRPLSPASAWLYTCRRMNRRKYGIGNIAITGRKDVGYAVYADGVLIARAVLVGEEVVITKNSSDPEVDLICKNILEVYDHLLNFVTTEKISEVASLFFRQRGATPLRPQRGDFYLLRDTEELRDFIQLVEERNLNRELYPHCFILTKIDVTTVDVLRRSIAERIASLEARYEELKAAKKDARTLISDVKAMQISIENLGDLLLDDLEIRLYKRKLESLLKKAERLAEKAKKGIYRRKVL